MPSEDSPAVLVARFLRANDYTETLNAFIAEAGLPIDVGSEKTKALTIEQVLQEKKAFDLSVNFEKLGVDERDLGWTATSRYRASTLDSPSSSNVLFVAIEKLRSSDASNGPQKVLLACTADRRLNVFGWQGSNFSFQASHSSIADSPILAVTAVQNKFLLCSSMSGKLIVWDTVQKTVIEERKDHTKYVVQVEKFIDEEAKTTWIATAGWDGKVFVYSAKGSEESFQLGEPVFHILQPTNPEALLFVRDPRAGALHLVITRRDSSFMYFYRIPHRPETDAVLELNACWKQNLAPESNAWVAFTPAAMALCPTDSTLAAVATSAVPHMKLLIVRLLFPSRPSAPEHGLASSLDTPPEVWNQDDVRALTQTQQARAELAIQEREAAAVQIHCTTLAPQTRYSTPALAWRPDGSGVWVNGDDGIVRGIEACSGKIMVALDKGHEAGSKVRCVCAGALGDEDSSEPPIEFVISGGFDQRLVSWHPEPLKT